jgi:hypothetical protein
MPVSRSVGSHGYGDVWHVVPRCNDDQVQNHNYEHYSTQNTVLSPMETSRF